MGCAEPTTIIPEIITPGSNQNVFWIATKYTKCFKIDGNIV